MAPSNSSTHGLEFRILVVEVSREGLAGPASAFRMRSQKLVWVHQEQQTTRGVFHLFARGSRSMPAHLARRQIPDMMLLQAQQPFLQTLSVVADA